MFFINFMLFLIDTPFKVLDIKKRGFQMKKMEKKYIPLAQFFETCTDNTFTLTYDEIQNIMGHELPNAAFLNSSWWKKTKAPSTHYFAWTNSNYQVIHVHLGLSVTFSCSQQEDNLSEKPKNTFIIRSDGFITAACCQATRTTMTWLSQRKCFSA